MFRRILIAIFLFAPGLLAYSVLSHEAIIDSAWDVAIKPVLQKRFPHATDDELLKAHAYAYGGAIIQDMGYYPFGSHQFSDLVHYLRSGDFIQSLIAESQDLNEYAFALGSLAHYAADNIGHEMAVNRAVPMVYPKLKAKYGPVVTYEDDPIAHLKTEFSFDVSQVAENHYAPDSYHRFIGFEVSKELLERSFEKTYAIRLTDISTMVDLALGTFRHTVSSLIPEMTKVAWEQKKDELRHSDPSLTKKRFVYNVSRASYEKEWGKDYERPGCGAHILAFLFRILPKIGPLRAFSFQPATPEITELFMQSFNKTLVIYKQKLALVTQGAPLGLENDNFDTGEPAHYGKYRLADEACGKLMKRLGERNFDGADLDLRSHLISFYAGSTPQDAEVRAALEKLRSLPAQAAHPK